MESTSEFLAKLHDTQRKDERNRQRQGKGHQGFNLPGKQHSTNK